MKNKERHVVDLKMDGTREDCEKIVALARFYDVWGKDDTEVVGERESGRVHIRLDGDDYFISSWSAAAIWLDGMAYARYRMQEALEQADQDRAA